MIAPQQEAGYSHYSDDEIEGLPLKNASREIQQGFIRKVYGILTAQLLLTVVIAGPISTVGKAWVASHSYLMLISLFMTLACICGMSCCGDAARRAPINFILLFTFTAFEAILVGFVSAQYTWQSVVLAAGVTCVVFFGMTAFAMLTKIDFTGLGMYFMGGLMSLMAFGFMLSILSMCGVSVKPLMMLYDLGGVMLFTMYIVYDTQLILGGDHQQQFSVDDYIFAALHLYLDIINLFMYILELLGSRDN
mmetsp:Transcript_25595/g.56441  ORF Transcript_25595/g.56441 Transcript_25595/m.56441 type:complete len:249 (-) Transcript_25595:140-886(-)